MSDETKETASADPSAASVEALTLEEQLALSRAANEALRAQVAEIEAVLEKSMADNEQLHARYVGLNAQYEELVSRHEQLAQLAQTARPAPASEPSASIAPTSAVSQRYRARVRLGLSSGDVMPGDEFEASSEEIEGLRAGEHFDVVG